jgi:hypothetical protein
MILEILSRVVSSRFRCKCRLYVYEYDIVMSEVDMVIIRLLSLARKST